MHFLPRPCKYVILCFLPMIFLLRARSRKRNPLGNEIIYFLLRWKSKTKCQPATTPLGRSHLAAPPYALGTALGPLMNYWCAPHLKRKTGKPPFSVSLMVKMPRVLDRSLRSRHHNVNWFVVYVLLWLLSLVLSQWCIILSQKEEI